MQYAIPKGVFDILPEEPKAEDQWRASDRWQYVEAVMRQTAHEYGFLEIRTPIFERTELFLRSVGESSDIVTKEMYTFEDKGGRSLSLRPEGTASAIRSFVENRLYTTQTQHKYFYIGPMFRYERPQAGRYRQHHQFGAEAIGIDTPEQDVEMIDMLCTLYKRLGLEGLSVMINSVGDPESRGAYVEALQEYLRPFLPQLSADSQTRFTKNPLRILDSKDPGDQSILLNAPSILDTLSEKARDHFARVCQLLTLIGIPFKIEPKLVRGLDYYNRTVFEVVCGDLGAQNTIGAGGRYDGLIHSFGGPDLPAVGFATGIERLLQTMLKQAVSFPPPPHPQVFIIALGEESRKTCFELLCKLRRAHIAAVMDLGGKKIQQALQIANKMGASYCLVIGETELQQQKAQLKNMATRETEDVFLLDIVKFLKEKKSHV
jgi:histidyl-tRNA synthetase